MYAKWIAVLALTIALGSNVSAQTLTVTPNPAVVGEPIYATFTAPVGSSATDWIGFYNAGDPNTAFLRVWFTGGATAGTVVHNAPLTPGNYEFRYLTNNSFTSVTSIPVTVSSAAGFSVSVSASSANSGDPVVVTWAAPAGRPATDWIGIFPAGETDNHNFDPMRWIYTQGATSGSHTFTMPDVNGPVVARYLVRDSYAHVAQSSEINVSHFSVTASATTSAPGGTVTATWVAPAGRPALDWIGVFPVGSNNFAWITWIYTGGATSGSHAFTMPTTPGQYEFRYLLNDGSTDVARSQIITVQ